MNVEVRTQITDVCLYRKGARVTRTGTVNSKDKEIVISGLPLTLDDDSIQIEAADSFYCQSYTVTLQPYNPSINQNRISRLRSEIAGLDRHLNSIKKQISELQQAVPQKNKSDEIYADFEQMAEAALVLSEFKDVEITNLNSFRQAIEMKIKELTDEIINIEKNKDLDKVCTKTIRLELSFKKQEKGELKIHYIIPDASWCPSYAIDVDDQLENGSFTMKALVCQNSGEDWSHVNMALSSSLPYRFKNMDELKSLYIGRKQDDNARRTWKPSPEDTENLFNDFDGIAGIKTPTAKKKSRRKYKYRRNHKNPPRLIILSEIMRGKSYDITDLPLTFGRTEDCDICIPDGTLSSLHATIDNVRGRLEIKDERSCNGTRINGERIYKAFLQSSDIIQLGGIEILFDDEIQELRVSNTTQTSINLDHDLYSSVNILCEEDSDGSHISHMKSINPMNCISIGDLDCLIGDDSSFMESSEAIEMLSNKVFNLSSLLMEIKYIGKRGKLNWNCRKELYKRQILQQGFSPSDFEKVYENIEKTDLSVNRFPSEMTLPENPAFSFVIEADTVVNVPSSKHHHIIPVSRKECKLKTVFVSVPRESENFFRVSTFDNPFSFYLTGGPVDIFKNRNFLSNGFISITETGKVEVCLGQESRIKLVRRTEFKEDQEGLVLGKSLLHHSIINQVTSTMTRPVEIKILERLPTPDKGYEKNIKVRLEGVAPVWKQQSNPEELLEKNNIYYWNTSIPPGENREFKFRYDIIIPAKDQIGGGNRREFA